MVILMRMNMPVQYRTIITEVLGDLQFNFYHRWFDVTFLVAALITIGILALVHKRSDHEKADTSYSLGGMRRESSAGSLKGVRSTF